MTPKREKPLRKREQEQPVMPAQFAEHVAIDSDWDEVSDDIPPVRFERDEF